MADSTLTPIRARMLALASAAIALGDASDGLTTAHTQWGTVADAATPYRNLIAYGETPAAADAMARMSGCGLVVRGLLARALLNIDCQRFDPLPDEWIEDGLANLDNLGVRTIPSELAPPYATGSVMTKLVSLAQRTGAWRTIHLPSTRPRDGDFVLLEGPEHVFTVTSTLDGVQGALRVSSVDGGQLDATGRQTIKTRVRFLSSSVGEVRAFEEGHASRRVVGFCDLDALASASVLS